VPLALLPSGGVPPGSPAGLLGVGAAGVLSAAGVRHVACDVSVLPAGGGGGERGGGRRGGDGDGAADDDVVWAAVQLHVPPSQLPPGCVVTAVGAALWWEAPAGGTSSAPQAVHTTAPAVRGQVDNSPRGWLLGGWVAGWVGGWVGGWLSFIIFN
jgi:hypothetical protein